MIAFFLFNVTGL